MSVLSLLARVIRVETPIDVHAYALSNAVDIAFSLGIEVPAYLDMLDEQIVAALPARLTRAMKEARKGAKSSREAAMQRAADVMGHTIVFADGNRAALYLAPFLESIVAGPEMLAFPRWDMAVSLDVLRRFRPQAKRLEWCAFVDREGLHIRWSRAVTVPGGRKQCNGGLNVRAQRIHTHRELLECVVCEVPMMHGPIYVRRAPAEQTRAA